MRACRFRWLGVAGLFGYVPCAVSFLPTGFLAKCLAAYRKRARKLFYGLRALCRFSGVRFLEEHLRCMVVKALVLIAQKRGGHVASAHVQASKGAVKFHQITIYEQGGIAIILVF